jgi:hypothetical protein
MKGNPDVITGVALAILPRSTGTATTTLPQPIESLIEIPLGTTATVEIKQPEFTPAGPETTAAAAAPAARQTTAAAGSRRDSEVFAAADAQVLPATANSKDGTIDVVWYSGAFVPRIDRSTGEPYMLKLDMDGRPPRPAEQRRAGLRYPLHRRRFQVAHRRQGRHAGPGRRRPARVAQRRQGHGHAPVRYGRSGWRGDVPQGQHRHPPEPQLRDVHLQAGEDRHADGGHAGGKSRRI